jgi:hypothetical protein
MTPELASTNINYENWREAPQCSAQRAGAGLAVAPPSLEPRSPKAGAFHLGAFSQEVPLTNKDGKQR